MTKRYPLPVADVHYPIGDLMYGALDRYVNDRLPPGSFLTAVLENNLKDAVGRADSFNIINLHNIVGYIYNYAPQICWGSPAKVDAWLHGPETI